MSFTPINTQEEFDKAIRDRLEREAKKYESQITELTTKAKKVDEQTATIASLQKELSENKGKFDKVAELEAKIKGYETSSVKMRIAHETGLPYEMAERLRGDDEKAIREDAETMKKYMAKPRGADPDFNSDRSGGAENDKAAALKSMLSSLKGE